MKKTFFTLAILFVTTLVAFSQTVIDSEKEKVVCTVNNPGKSDVVDAPVVLSIKNPKWRSATVMAGKIEIPSQFDIFDNGKTRELSFVVDLKANKSDIYTIFFSESAPEANRYRPRVNAQMFLKEGGEIVPKDVISSDRDNMYNQLHHHGPAFESELTAYRIYFDQKQTIDIYGKVLKRLELPITMWYPTDKQLVEKYGDDVLFVGASVGVGALKGWEDGRATHIRRMTNREMSVLAKGPVRTVVDVNVKGWEHDGKTIDLHSRYYLYAGHRDAEIVHTFSGDVSGMAFATGVQKIRKGDVMHTDGKGMVADWGRDFPVNDTVKYPQQTVGLAIDIPHKYVVSQEEDAINYLYTVKPDVDKKIIYRITFAAEKEEFGYKSPEEFFRYIDMWKEEVPVQVVSVK